MFRQFWEVGVKLLNGEDVECLSFTPLRSPEQEVKVAAAQFAPSRSVESNLARMEDMIREAVSNGADLVTFPELAVTGAAQSEIEAATEAIVESALVRIGKAAGEQRVTVVFGMPAFEDGRRQNCAFAVGPEGQLLTRYAQIVVDRPQLFSPGLSTRAMWFQVKGSWAAVTMGGDALWSEMAELAAVRGAQIHCHLAHDPDQTAAAALRRRQLWVNLASFHTLTVTVNAACPDELPDRSLPGSGESIIWEDFHRAIQGGHGGFAPYSAYPVCCAGRGEEIIYATRQLPAVNPQFEDMTGRVTPQMKPWYSAGALAMDAEA